VFIDVIYAFFCCANWTNRTDILVFILSIAGCAVYIVDFNHKNDSLTDAGNLAILILRCARDVIRVIRCIWFFRLLYSTMIRLDDHNRYRSNQISKTNAILVNNPSNSSNTTVVTNVATNSPNEIIANINNKYNIHSNNDTPKIRIPSPHDNYNYSCNQNHNNYNPYDSK